MTIKRFAESDRYFNLHARALFLRSHYSAGASCSARISISTLNFAVVESPLAVFCQHIKAHAAPIEIVRTLLRDDMFDDEIIPPEEDPQ